MSQDDYDDDVDAPAVPVTPAASEGNALAKTGVGQLVEQLGGSAPKRKAKGKAGAQQPSQEAAPQDDGEALPATVAEGAANTEASAPEAAAAAGSGSGVIDRLPIDHQDDLSELEGDASLELMTIVESLLFAAPRPLRVRDLRKVLPDIGTKPIQLALKALMQRRAQDGVTLSQVASGFVFSTHRKNASYVQTLLQAKPIRLSRPQLECLAVIAYRQPITRPEIDHVRGVDSGGSLKSLLERDLIAVVGRAEEAGRPLLYGTTVHFLEFFSLMSLRDLPDLREFRELSAGTMNLLRAKMGAEEAEAIGQEVLDYAGVARPEPLSEPILEDSTESADALETAAMTSEAAADAESEAERGGEPVADDVAIPAPVEEAEIDATPKEGQDAAEGGDIDESLGESEVSAEESVNVPAAPVDEADSAEDQEDSSHDEATALEDPAPTEKSGPPTT